MTISRQVLFGKLNQALFRSIESATTFCKLRGNSYVELVHWVHQLLQVPDGDLQRVIRHCDIHPDNLDRDVLAALAALPAGASSVCDFSHHVDMAVERAWVVSTLEFGDNRIRGRGLIVGLVTTPELRRVLVDISPEFRKIPVDTLSSVLPAWVDGSPELDSASGDQQDTSSALSEAGSPGQQTGRSPLERFCVDLTARARAGEMDPVVGRDLEIRTMIDVLLRRRQNNPLLVGEAGVGKTAVAEGLAHAIASGNVPPKLLEARLLSLDVGALLAGAGVKGEFEARLKGVLEAVVKSSMPVILFVDEIHTLIGAGGQAGTGDAANLLKPVLARGSVRMIGATTWAEYKRHVEKDAALTRRFQVLQIMEPEEVKALDMVRSLAQAFAQHHGVMLLDEAIRAAVTLSHRYIPARQLPDKAISLLDTACARVALSQHAPPRALQDVRQRLAAARVELGLLEQEVHMGVEPHAQLRGVLERIASLEAQERALGARWHEEAERVSALLDARSFDEQDDADGRLDRLHNLETSLKEQQGDEPLVFAEVSEAVVAGIVSDWTGIPVGRMVTDEVAAVRTLSEVLEGRVIGQAGALRQISERVQTARARLTDPTKPLGVFLLAGPSGVGKTETALALAGALYGGEQNIITINMSEYQEAHTVSGLKGAPPGYVGYGEGGRLTEAVRRRPYSVVLLDEIEKAHHDVHEMFFQVFDKGYMEDGDGRYIDFRNTIILLTSNVGAELTLSLCADSSLAPDNAVLCEALRPELLKTFPAAFLGRVAVVPYRPLAETSLAQIVQLHLDRVVGRMVENHQIAFVYTPAVVDYVVAHCLVQETGARVLIGFIEQHVLPRLAAIWLETFSTGIVPGRIALDIVDVSARPAEALIFRSSME
ncbi:type VI secretion system ATPase TssH [Paraburkholderia aspalathi]|uniref:type VI secretion system ATPase TssH n=1 Tax=Paraburkholderia aspalathi TaxID=1324617 RepID=UPI0038B6C5FB